MCRRSTGENVETWNIGLLNYRFRRDAFPEIFLQKVAQAPLVRKIEYLIEPRPAQVRINNQDLRLNFRQRNSQIADNSGLPFSRTAATEHQHMRPVPVSGEQNGGENAAESFRDDARFLLPGHHLGHHACRILKCKGFAVRNSAAGGVAGCLTCS